MTYKTFFQKLTGFPPFNYQERTCNLLLEGKSLILRVPTGAGKTWAAVAPFLYSLQTDHAIADRLIYALPLRSLASSLQKGVVHEMKSAMTDVREIGKDRDYDTDAKYCSLQMGGQKDDPFFESDIVFTTIDQVLSSYLFLPVSLPDRLGNMNAGALIGSLLVLDEVHLLDPEVALGTVVEMLDRLGGLTQFVLMTATLSASAIKWLADKLRAEEVVVPDDEILALPSQRTKKRVWSWNSEPLSAATVKERHEAGRTIALVNSVGRSQTLFKELESAYAGESDPPTILLLHSRFFSDHRKAVENRLDEYFGPKATQSNVILVSTQVVEAGIDISADHLHTELAPLNSLVQRAGRSARYLNRNTGTVTVYEPTGLGPYREQKNLMDDTRRVLAAELAESRNVDFLQERDWIDSVHGPRETAKLAAYNSLRTRRDLVNKAMDDGDRGRLSQLVRDNDSVSVLVHGNPEEIDFSRRRWPLLLGVPSVSLMTLSNLFRSLSPGQWIAKGAHADDQDERPGFSLKWDAVSSPGHLRGQWLVALHPGFACYDERLGLILGRGGPQPPLVYSEVSSTPRYQYEFETWTDHSRRVAAAGAQMKRVYIRASGLLDREYNLPVGFTERLVELVCILHDTGKMASEWQKRAWLWQDDKDARMHAAGCFVPGRPRVPIAHTWFDPLADKAFAAAAKYRFPPHAVQGAYAVANTVLQFLAKFGADDQDASVAKSMLSAIARHHGPRVRNLDCFSLDPKAGETLDLFSQWRPAIPLAECNTHLDASDFAGQLLSFNHEDDQRAWPLYAFLVRRLRLADQGSFSSAP